MSDTPRTRPEENTEELTAQRPHEPLRPEALRSEQQHPPGQRLVGRYTVLQVLGEGGMGVVLAAYDERLDRRVALKLLRRGHSDTSELELRLVREAQAMARLSHPHVVAVYDSGRLEDGTFFIAMEHVEGRTLRDWCQQQRPWRQVLGAYLEAGRGLAAAHAAGLVHRDFKPANVLVGSDERVRVTDFGVARSEGSTHTPHTPFSLPGDASSSEVSLTPGAWETPLTLQGNVVGTPKYLAPELFKGQPADARSDLFSFCIALYEALYGQPPFAGATVVERLKAQQQGRLTPPPPRTEVPAWVGRALARGLSADPRQRPVSMQALLALLEDDPEVRRRERLRAGGLACGALALVGLAAWGWMRGQGPGCGAMDRRLAGVWDAPVRQRVRQTLEATGLGYAADTAGRVEAVLEGYSGAWVRMSQEVCEAAGTRGAQARGLTLLREACLERRRGQLRALTELLAHGPDPALVPKAVRAAQALPPLEYCADERALMAAVPPPEDPALRARVEALQRQVDRLAALDDAGQYKQGVAQLEVVLAEVAGVDFAPLRAQALYLAGRLHSGAGEYPQAEARLREAIPLAARGGDDVLLAHAWSSLLSLVGDLQGRHAEALALELTLRSVSERARDERTRSHAHNSLGNVLEAAGRYEEARAHHERALALREQVWGPEHTKVAESLNNLGNVLQSMGRYEEALEKLERALAMDERALGSGHPHVASVLTNLGNVFFGRGRYEEALARHERALALREQVLGPEHAEVAAALNNIGIVLQRMGRYEEALARYERTLAVLQKALGPQHPHVGHPHANMGNVFQSLGRYEDARARHERALALWSKGLGPEHPNVGIALNNLGMALESLGRTQEALERHEQALALRLKVLGPEHPHVASSLTNLGRALQALGRPQEAQARFEAALVLREKLAGPDSPQVFAPLLGLGDLHLEQRRPERAVPLLQRALALALAADKPEAQLLLARALWDSGGDRRRAVQLATEAHAQWQAQKHPLLPKATRWLATHRAP